MGQHSPLISYSARAQVQIQSSVLRKKIATIKKVRSKMEIIVKMLMRRRRLYEEKNERFISTLHGLPHCFKCVQFICFQSSPFPIKAGLPQILAD